MIHMFDTILTFLAAHWDLILHIVLLLVSSVLFIIKKKPTKVVDGLLENIYKFCIAGISYAESTGLKGSDKLEQAIAYVLHDLQELYPDIKLNVYVGLIKQIIEAILSTPQKKG